VRRWEVERGLPIHRVPGSNRGAVYAFVAELEEWLRRPSPPEESAVRTSPAVTADSEADENRTATEAGRSGNVPADRQPSRAGTEVGNGGDVRSGAHVMPWVLAVALVLTVFGAIYAYRRTVRFAARAAAQRPDALNHEARIGLDSVAVLPFTNAGGDVNTDYLSDGITESLIGNLAHIPQLKVRSRDSVFRYKGKNTELRAIGSELGVSMVVSGRVAQLGDTLEVSAELTNIRDNTEIWGNHYKGKNANLVALQKQIAGDVAEKLRSTLNSAEMERVTDQGTQVPEAYSLYLKGRYAFYNRTFVRLHTAISRFNQAVAKDPNYALAYSGIADAYSVLPDFGGNPGEDYPKSNAAARRALELDPTLAHPHAVLGSNEMGYDWDFAGGEAEFKKAIELDPNDATAHQWYAERLAVIGGREKEALAEIDLAHQLDPDAPVIRRVQGSVLVMARRFDEAIALCKQLENDDPSNILAHDCLGYAYWGKRMYAQAVEEWKTYGQLTGNPDEARWSEALDRGFRAASWKGALTEAIRVLETRRRTSYASPYMIARLYADLGDKEKAFEWLDIAYREHDWLLIELNTGFQVDSLRSDPRFDQLVKEVGLPNAPNLHHH
jgi:TolB-like protein/cytochrome c-type biogenesis protein CcmH/NrfG